MINITGIFCAMTFLFNWTIKLIPWEICGKKLKTFYFLLRCFPAINMIGSSHPISEKKLPHKKLPQLLSTGGLIPLMMNKNSKILPIFLAILLPHSPSLHLPFTCPLLWFWWEEDSLSPRTQTFFLWWWPKVWQVNSPPPPPGKLPTTNCPLKIAPIKTELLHGRMHTHLKGLIGFSLLFLFYSQQEEDSLNMSNFFYHLTFQPWEKYSNFQRQKEKKDQWSLKNDRVLLPL